MNAPVNSKAYRPIRIDLSRTFIRRVDLSNARLIGTDFSFADCSNANFRGADFRDAILEGTILKGADLTGAKNLTRKQIARAVIDERTILPEDLAA
jgi:uncharacterized protein YjbI with pentapeptide repeats